MTKPAAYDLKTILDSLHNRRDFLKLFGKGLGYSALVSTLSAASSQVSASLVLMKVFRVSGNFFAIRNSAASAPNRTHEE